MADEKTMATDNENVTPEKEKQQGTDSPAENKEEKASFVKKFGEGFRKHGKKIGIGLGLAAAFAGGLMAEKVGLPCFGKKDPDQTEQE